MFDYLKDFLVIFRCGDGYIFKSPFRDANCLSDAVFRIYLEIIELELGIVLEYSWNKIDMSW